MTNEFTGLNSKNIQNIDESLTKRAHVRVSLETQLMYFDQRIAWDYCQETSYAESQNQ